MLCDFYGEVLIPPTEVERIKGNLIHPFSSNQNRQATDPGN